MAEEFLTLFFNVLMLFSFRDWLRLLITWRFSTAFLVIMWVEPIMYGEEESFLIISR